MGLEPITVTLTTYEKLEILRTELKSREEEFKSVERDLRGAMRALAQHRYLKSLSTFYTSQPDPGAAAMVPELDKRRQALSQVVAAIRAEIPRLESAAVSGVPAPPPRLENRRTRFE
jgi:hypothetical protein